MSVIGIVSMERQVGEKAQQAVQLSTGGVGGKNQKVSSLDELFRATLEYRTSDSYLELIKFISRFPRYAPFNCFLLYTQNPKITFVATPVQWQTRFGRSIRRNARPLVILAPMGPVVFVYDLPDTEGDKLPREIERPFETSGVVPDRVWFLTCSNCEERDRIAILAKQLSIFRAGAAMTNSSGSVLVGRQQHAAKCVVHLNGSHTREQQYATLVHELGHVHCGHLGGDRDGWWPDRRAMSSERMEFEAESVSHLVCTRLGLATTSAQYLGMYTKENSMIPEISLDTVLKVAGYVESLGRKQLKPRKIGRDRGNERI
jgi:hypothetical protein